MKNAEETIINSNFMHNQKPKLVTMLAAYRGTCIQYNIYSIYVYIVYII